MNGLQGTAALVRLALRRERLIAPVWIALLLLMVVGTAINYGRLFPEASGREQFAQEMARNRIVLAFGGAITGTSVGALAVWRVGDSAYTALALLLILTVVRHTRADEEAGRQELLGATVVGRYAPLTAALLVACGASGLVAALAALGLVGLGLEPVGAAAFGLALTGIGWVFAAVAALAAQLVDTARASQMLAFFALGGSWLVRFVADGSGQGWLGWLSPNGWSHLLAPFGHERWGVVGLMVVASVCIAGGAYALAARRDLGAGVLPARPGPAAGKRLGGVFALAWRLQRGLLAGWVVGFGVIGIALGGLASTLPNIVLQNVWAAEFVRRYSGSASASFGDIVLEIIIISLGMTVAFYGALATLRLRAEEVAGHTELLLSTPVSRARWMASHLAFGVGGTVAVLASSGLMLGLSYGLSRGSVGVDVPRVLGGSLLHACAAWVLVGVVAFVFGAAPRAAVALTWAALLYVQLIGDVLGPIVWGAAYRYQLVNALQPFHWVPKITSGALFTPAPLLALAGLAALLTAGGLVAFRRRDLA